MKLEGTMCSRMPENVILRCEASVMVAETCSTGRPTPTPGFTTFTAMRPTASASVVTISKYRIDLNASFPTFFMSSPCPAIPTTSVANSSGAINDLIMLRKIVDSGLSATARPGASHPSSTPTIIEMMIHCVSEIRRIELAMESFGVENRLSFGAARNPVVRRAVPSTPKIAIPADAG